MEILEQANNYVADKLANIPTSEATMDDVDLKGLASTKSLSSPKSPSPILTPSRSRSAISPHTIESSERCIASNSIADPRSRKAHDKALLEVIVKVPHSAAVSVVRNIGDD